MNITFLNLVCRDYSEISTIVSFLSLQNVSRTLSILFNGAYSFWWKSERKRKHEFSKMATKLKDKRTSRSSQCEVRTKNQASAIWFSKILMIFQKFSQKQKEIGDFRKNTNVLMIFFLQKNKLCQNIGNFAFLRTAKNIFMSTLNLFL